MLHSKVLFFLVLLGLCLADREYFSKTRQQFSTRTLYDYVRGDLRIKQPGMNCYSAGIWVLARNGASYPTKEEIQSFSQLSKLKEDILDNHKRWGRGKLDENQLQDLKNWSLDMDPEMAGRLIETKTIHKFALRVLNNFPEFDNNIKVKFTSSPNTNESAVAFFDGIGSLIRGDVDDELLVLKQHGKKTNESALFRQGKEMSAVLKSVTERLGFTNLNISDIENMYKLCTYDSIFRNSPWCGMFTDEEMKVMEYYEDLYTYDTHYGFLNEGIDWKPTKDIVLDMLQRLIDFKEGERSTLYFSDDVAVRNLLVYLQLENSRPIYHDNFRTSEYRSWRNSFLTPFSGNIISVLHRCYGGLIRPENYYISFYLNEKPVYLPYCKNTFCGLNSFVNYIFPRDSIIG